MLRDHGSGASFATFTMASARAAHFVGSKQSPARAPRAADAAQQRVGRDAWSGNQNAVRCYAKMALGSLQSGADGQPLQALQGCTSAMRGDPSDYPSLTFVNAPRETSGQPFAGMAAIVPLS
jgi:hypothetical protein